MNECLVDEATCKTREYCENTIGSFICYECDPGCKTSCSGKGPDKCIGECNKGYKPGNTLASSSPNTYCIDVNECEESASACNEKMKCVNTIGGFECVGKISIKSNFFFLFFNKEFKYLKKF